MKKTLGMILVLFAAIQLVGVNNVYAGPSKDKTANYLIGFSNVNDIYPYCIKFRDYLVSLAAVEGMTVIVTDGASNVERQNDQISNFIVQGARIVTAISVDQDGTVPAVEECKRNKIPYISFIKNVRNEGNYNAYIYIGSDNYDAGLMQGQYIAKTAPQNAIILYTTGPQNSAQYADRKRGLIDGMKSRADLKIASEMLTNNTKDLGINVTEDWMNVYSKIDVIVGQNDDSILGAIEALKAANRLKGVITIGLDGSDDGLASIKRGEMTMSVLQDAKGQAQAGVEVFKKIRSGVDPATITDIIIPYKPITVDIVDEFIVKK